MKGLSILAQGNALGSIKVIHRVVQPLALLCQRGATWQAEDVWFDELTAHA